MGTIGETLLSVRRFYRNEAGLQYKLAPPLVQELASAINKFGGDGRVFILGFILHDLGATAYDTQDGGHVASLAMYTSKHFYASDFYHSKWETVDPIPREYRKRGSAGVEEFLDLMNVSSVVTFNRTWSRYCLKNPKYREVFHQGRFRLFTRVAPTQGYFLSGAGELELFDDGFTVIPKTEEVVLKFRYLNSIRAYGGGELFSVSVHHGDRTPGLIDEVQFVGLRFSPEELRSGVKVTVRAEGSWYVWLR